MLRSLILGYNLNWSLKMRKSCLRNAIRLLGVNVISKNHPPQGTFMYIGNHRSYLDPIITLCHAMALPVAKAEVSKWPLIGYAAKVTGIVFVKRESRYSRKQTLDTMLEILQKGHSVLIYPEGTTHGKNKTIAFKKGAFRLAAENGFPIIPMMIDYLDENDYWVGNDTFIPHFLRSFAKWETTLVIKYGQPITGNDKEKLLQETQYWIDNTLQQHEF